MKRLYHLPTILFTSLTIITVIILPSTAFVVADTINPTSNNRRQHQQDTTQQVSPSSSSSHHAAQTSSNDDNDGDDGNDNNNNDDVKNKTNDRDISSLLKWASQNSIQVSPHITLTSSTNDAVSGDGSSTDYGVVLNHKTITSTATTAADGKNDDNEPQPTTPAAPIVLLQVPKTVLLDSKQIYDEWNTHLRQSMDHIQRMNFGDARHNFVLVVKVLREYSLYHHYNTQQQQDPTNNAKNNKHIKGVHHEWIQSLPRTFTTGTTLTPLELDCLPPFSRAMADYERRRLLVFKEALQLMIRGRQRNRPLLEEWVVDDEELVEWAFNVVATRSWVYDESDDEDGDIVVGGEDYEDDEEMEAERQRIRREENLQSIMVPLGDMFNHRDPPNVVVRDSPSSKEVQFVLVDDGDGDTRIDDEGGGGDNIFISYGISTNPHRFLIRFGFVNTQMNEIFSQILFTNPSPQLIALGCNDRTKMVYRTLDGAISTPVWDTVLYSLLVSEVPEEAKLFYEAHVRGDGGVKAGIHRRYVLETSLVLRTHVMKELKELGELLRKIEGIQMTSSSDSSSSCSDEEGDGDDDDNSCATTTTQTTTGGGGVDVLEHPRLPMIRQYNEFLYGTLDMVRRRIDARAQGELARRKKSEK